MPTASFAQKNASQDENFLKNNLPFLYKTLVQQSSKAMSSPPGDVELCDGIDNNGDGAIDQFPVYSGNVFLQGNYLEIGVAPCGSFGSSVAAPAGYHPRGASNHPLLGFVADLGKDGWGVGSPDFCGDYFVPGSPEEGWGLTIDGSNYNNNQLCAVSGIPGSIVSNSVCPDINLLWTGAVAGLDIQQYVHFPTDKIWFVVEVTLTNNTASTMNDIYYHRNVDPDQDVAMGGSYSTTNTIVSQNPNAQNLALVSAVGTTSCYLALGTRDPRSRVTHGGFSNRSASDIWNGVGLHTSGSIYADKAISLAFKIETLAPGESTTLKYAYMLDAADIDEALDGTSPYYPDDDGDGFGDGTATPVYAASAPPGYVDNGTDCNDNDNTIHPNAPEILDGIDNNCNGQVDEGSANIAGSVGASQSISICSGSGVPATLNLTGHTGSVIKWQSSPNGSAWTDIVNTTTSYSPPALTVTTHFRAVVQNGTDPAQNSTAAIITVNGVSVGGTVTPSQTICSGTAPYAVFLQNQVGNVVKWQSSIDGGGSWVDITSTATSHLSGPLTTTTKFRAVVQSGVCTAMNSTISTITVNPSPTVSLPNYGPYCANAAAVSLVGSPVGGSYSGPGVSGSTFSPTAAGAGSHSITYTFTNGQGCSATATKIIVVNALPTVTVANFTAVCLNTPVFALTNGSPSGGTYSGPGVSGGNFNPVTAGTGTKTIVYTFTNGSGCTASASKTIVVNGLPDAGLAPFAPTCTITAPFSLTGGTPAGGVYSGPGVSGGIFTPATAGAGVHVINYMVTNGSGCSTTATKNLTVSGSCSPTCTILTCPPARDLPMTAACKITIPNLVSEAVIGGDCNAPYVVSQSPAAGLVVAATHNSTQNVVITVVDMAGITTVCTVVLTAKDQTGPTISNCPTSPSNSTMTAACKITILNYMPATNATDCSGPLVKTQLPTPGTVLTVTHLEEISVVVTVTDAAGNSTTCTRTVIAKDLNKPLITTCPPAQTIGLNASCQLLVPDKTGQMATTDGCSNPVSKAQNPTAGTPITTTPGTTHTVVFTATDAAGNTRTCTTILTAGACAVMLVGNDDSDKVETEKAPDFIEKTMENNPAIAENPLELQPVPNPFSDELTIAFDLAESGKTKLVLMDLTGQFQFLEKENWLEKGRQKVVWNTEDLPGGAYFVGLKTESAGWIWRKVILVR